MAEIPQGPEMMHEAEAPSGGGGPGTTGVMEASFPVDAAPSLIAAACEGNRMQSSEDVGAREERRRGDSTEVRSETVDADAAPHQEGWSVGFHIAYVLSRFKIAGGTTADASGEEGGEQSCVASPVVNEERQRGS